MKICKTCQIEKSENQYSPYKWSKDGLAYDCKQCRAIAAQKRRIELGIKPKIRPKIPDDQHKECLKCRKIKHIDSFPISSRGRLDRGSYCDKCNKKFHKLLKQRPGQKQKQRKSSQKYRDNNREYWRSLHRIHQFNRRSNIKAKSDGTITNDFMKELYAKTECHWCKKSIPECDRTAEHIIPLAKGGIHGVSNLTMACISCNSSKLNFK